MRGRGLVVTAVAAAGASAAGVAFAASLAVTSKTLTGASVTTPAMYPVSVTIANGRTAGKPDKSDLVTLVWSKPIDEPTLCSGWANSSSTQSIALTWTLTPGSGGGDDSLAVGGTVPATCAGGFQVGTIDLGAAGYVTGGPLNFATTTALTVSATTSTLTVTFGNQNGAGTSHAVTGGGQATWSCSASLLDRSGRSCGSNVSDTTSSTQF
jgi:hypothetical protein